MPKKKAAAKKPTGGSSSKKPSPSSKPAKAAQASSAPRSSKPSPAAAAKGERKPANYGGTIEHDVSLERMHVDPANARRHPERNMQTIMASLRQHGQVEPLVVRLEDGQVIGGNGRYEAMRLLGWTACTVTWVDKSTIEAMGLGITLNRSAEQAEWDLDVLDKLTVNLEDAGVDLADLGFTGDELDDLLEAGDGEASSDGDVEEGDIPEPPAKPKTKPGDVWLLGQHRLMCGDSADAEAVAKLMAGKLANMVFTDPPYNIASANKGFAAGSDNKQMAQLMASEWDKNFDFATVEQSLLSALADDATVYVCTSHHLAPDIWKWMTQWASHTSYCVWAKPNPMPSLAKRHWTWNSELVCYATRGKQTFNFPDDGHALSVWIIAKNASNDLHPTMKPVAVPAHAIRHSSNPGQLVVDLFGGAGSTLLACEQLGRVCYTMEIDPRYVEVIKARWEEQTGSKAVLQPAVATATGAAKLAR